MTGVSIMLLDAGMDTGPVLSMEQLPILDDDNLKTVHDRLARLGAELLCKTLSDWKTGRIQPRPQDDTLATSAPPVKKEELHIDWDHTARRIVNRIRAFDPAPGAYSTYMGKRMKLFSASVLPWKGEGRPGEVVGEMEKGLVVLAGGGEAVLIGELQMEGQRRLPAGEFLRGRSIEPGSRFE
jgi:methionyl-tRNA formyltransferase